MTLGGSLRFFVGVSLSELRTAICYGLCITHFPDERLLNETESKLMQPGGFFNAADDIVLALAMGFA